MWASQSREGLDLSDYDSDDSDQYKDDDEQDENYEDAQETQPAPAKTIDDLDAKLKALKLKYASPSTPSLPNAVKLYLRISGNTPKAKWIVSDKLTSYKFVKTNKLEDKEDADEDELEGGGYCMGEVTGGCLRKERECA